MQSHATIDPREPRFAHRSALLSAALLLALLTMLTPPCPAQEDAYAAADELDLLPTPRHIELLEGTRSLAGWEIVVPDEVDLLQVGASEINARMTELGGEPLPVVDEPSGKPAIFIGRWWDPHIREICMELKVKLTPTNPGEQGYVIESGTYQDRPVILLGGSDKQGALYACVTFRRRMKDEENGVAARNARVRDWPDFKVRCNGRLNFYDLRHTSFSAENLEPLQETMQDFKEQIDFYLRHKVNFLYARGYFLRPLKDNFRQQQLHKAVLEVLGYADRRGIGIRLIGGVDLADYLTDEQKKRAVERRPGSAYMWAAFDAHRRKARDYAQFMQAAAADHLALHPLDSGFLTDPELWSRRSEATKRMYGNDRAWAEIEQFSLYFDILRQLNPTASREAVVFPYHYQAARPDFPQKYAELNQGMPNTGKYDFIESNEQASRVQQDIVRFWREVAGGLPDDVAIVFREGAKETFQAVADIFEGHPITIWIYPGRNKGWLGTFCPQVRMTGKTYWRPDHRDRYFMAFDMTRTVDGRPNRLAQQEYLWNVDRPDASDQFTVFSRFYEHGGREVSDFQKQHLIPRICRILYGGSAETYAKLVEANVSLNYVANPKSATTGHDADWLDDRYKYMGEQADKMVRLHDAFAGILGKVGEDGAPPRVDAWTVFYYRYTGLAAVKARLENAAKEVNSLLKAGEKDEARARAREILAQYEDIKQRTQAVRTRSNEAWKKVKTGPVFFPPFKSSRLKPLDDLDPEDFRTSFSKAL